MKQILFLVTCLIALRLKPGSASKSFNQESYCGDELDYRSDGYDDYDYTEGGDYENEYDKETSEEEPEEEIEEEYEYEPIRKRPRKRKRDAPLTARTPPPPSPRGETFLSQKDIIEAQETLARAQFQAKYGSLNADHNQIEAAITELEAYDKGKKLLDKQVKALEHLESLVIESARGHQGKPTKVKKKNEEEEEEEE